MELPLELESDHLMALLPEGRFIVDTGSPTSFGLGDSVEFAGERHPVMRELMGLDVAALRELSGIACDGLVGMDILARYDLLFDVPSGELVAETGELPRDRFAPEGRCVALDACMGIPIVSIDVAGASHSMFLDTGAPHSYLVRRIVGDREAIDTVADFYPGFGPFEAEIFRVPARLGDLVAVSTFGVLPELLEATLLLGGAEGIVGNEVMRERAVGLSSRRSLLGI